MNFKDALNETQYEAVQHTEGPLLILAGAGSGKTRVVTYKIAYLIKEIGVNPYDILAITFTNKAAREMKERSEILLNRPVEGLWIGTFHSICVRILRKNVSSNFTIYDTQDTNNLLKAICKELNLDKDIYRPSSIRSQISAYKNKGLGPLDHERDAGVDFYLSQVNKVFWEYEKRLKENNAYDFDDLLLKTVQLFRTREDILFHYANKFQYIFVDEYQDVNDIQYQLVKLLSSVHGNITVVGDENQSIYAFRGANLNNILNFEKDFPGAKVIYLNENYRSTTAILDCANALIQNNPQKYKRDLFTKKSGGEKVEYVEHLFSGDEAFFVAQAIEDLIDRGYSYGDMAILYRTNAQSRAFEDFFIRSSIPYEIIGGMRFYDRKEVKDAIAYLRLLSNPEDTISFERVVNTPRRGIGPKTMREILHLRSIEGLNCYEALAKGGTTKGVELAKLYQELACSRDTMTLMDLTKSLLERSGYISSLRLSSAIEDQSRLQNVEEFISYVGEFERLYPESGLEDLLAELSLLSDIDNKSDEDRVSLMTIHSAKGLEFPVVFVVGMEEGLFPSRLSMESDTEVEEERRLCYVAMTRAKKKLFLTSAQQRMLYGNTNYAKPSRFIDEVKELIQMDEKQDMKKDRHEVKPPNLVTTYKGSLGVEKKDVKKKKESFKAGDHITHKLWGDGMVVSVADDDIQIAFEGKGIKKLKVSIAPIEHKK
ncbi:MAG: 3'-5' exonuclease [Tissierellia bacterium]|nr:3'-5' exonuclease [Tissierellia bacterium]